MPDNVTKPRQANVFQVSKRSGETMVFVEDKLKSSIENALLAAGIEIYPLASQLVTEVIRKLEEELSYRESINTLDIQEAVEISFLERGLTSAASAYHDFGQLNDDVDNIDKTEELSDLNKIEDTEINKPAITVAEIIDKKKFTPVKPESEKPSATVVVLPEERSSITYKFVLPEINGYITVSLSSDNQPGEIILHSLDTLVNINLVYLVLDIMNISLQQGVSLTVLLESMMPKLNKLNEVTIDPDLELLHHICNWLQHKFC